MPINRAIMLPRNTDYFNFYFVSVCYLHLDLHKLFCLAMSQSGEGKNAMRKAVERGFSGYLSSISSLPLSNESEDIEVIKPRKRGRRITG